MADAQRLGALAQELAVAAHPLGVDRAHVEHLLGLGVVGGRARLPTRSRARRAQPASTCSGRPEAGSRVDHGRPADRAADGRRDRRAALGDRQAAVAVERRERGQRLVGVGVAVQVGPGLEHDDLEPRLGEDRRRDRAAGARADDRHVALLAAGRRAQVAEAADRRIGRRASRRRPRSASRSRPPPHPRVVAVAEAGQDLEEEQQVRGAAEGSNPRVGAGSPGAPRGWRG